MALTFRSDKGAALSINELDNNFRHFTGSHEISGSITLTEGGVSHTLSATDIQELRAGKSIVSTTDSRAKGTGVSTNYAQYDVLYNANDNTTFLDLSESGVIDFRADSETAFSITKPTTPTGKDGTITLGRDCIYKTQIRCDLFVSGNLVLDRVGSEIQALNASASFGNTAVNSLKVGDNSVTIAGTNTSYIKTSLITSTDGLEGSQINSTGIYNGSSNIGTSRILLGAVGSTYDSINSVGNGDNQSGAQTNQIKFLQGDVELATFTTDNLRFNQPILYSGVPAANDATNLRVLVLDDDGSGNFTAIKPGKLISDLGGDGAGEPNVPAFATASFIGAANIFADSNSSNINFEAAGGIIYSVDQVNQTVTITTGSNFTVPLTLAQVLANGNEDPSSNGFNINGPMQTSNTLTVGDTSLFSGNVKIDDANLFFNNATNGSQAIYLGVANANETAGSKLQHNPSANLVLQNFVDEKQIHLLTQGNIGIGTESPGQKIQLGDTNADIVRLFAQIGSTAGDTSGSMILMQNSQNDVQKAALGDLVGGLTISSSQIFDLNHFTVSDLPAGTVSGSSQIDELGFLQVVGDGVLSGSSLVAGTSQGEISLKTNGETVSTINVPTLGTDQTPSFVKLNLTGIAGDTTNERRPLVIVNNEIMSASADYATVDQVNGILASSGSFVLSVSASNDGAAVSTFEIFDSSSKLLLNAVGNGLTLSANGSTGIDFTLSDGVVSSSAQLADAISGSFNAASASLAANIATNVTNISTNSASIAVINSSTASYYTADSDVDGTGITNNTVYLGSASIALGASSSIHNHLVGSQIISSSTQITFDNITGISDVVEGTLGLVAGNGQGQVDLVLDNDGSVQTLTDNLTVTGLGTGGSPTFNGLSLTSLSGDSSVTPLVLGPGNVIMTGAAYTTADAIDPYDLDIATSGDSGNITITNAETLIISGAGGLDVSSDTNTITLTVGNGILSSSAQIATDISGVVDAATGSLLSNFTFFSGSSQVDFNSITGVPAGLVSGTIAFRNGDNDTATLLPSETASFIQTTQGTVFDIEVTDTGDGVQVNLYTPENIVSSSAQVDITGTTGYNTLSSSVDSNTTSINTNTNNISTNVSNISTNSSSIASLNAATSSYLTNLNGALSSSAFSSTAQGTLSASINGVTTIVDLGLETTDNVTFNDLTANGTVKFTNLPAGASTIPLVLGPSGQIMTGAAYSSFTSESDFSSFTAQGDVGSTDIGGAESLQFIGGIGIQTTASDVGQNGAVTINLDNSLGLLSSSAQIASDISGAFNAASASIATDIFNNDTDIAAVTASITNISTSLAENVANNTFNISVNSTDIDALQASASAGIRFEYDSGLGTEGFSLTAFETSSFNAAGGNGLNVSVNNNTVTYTLNGVVSSSSQIHSQISGAFDAASASIASDIATNVTNITTNTNAINSINSSTSSLENQNAYATASIQGGGSLTASGPSGELTFNAGSGIHLEIDNGAILITASGGVGGGTDNYIGNSQNHIAGGNLDMSDFNITNVEELEVDGYILMTAGGGNEGKIAFGGDLTNTFIQANSAGSNTEDLEIHADVDLLLRPGNNVGIKTVTPAYPLDVNGDIHTNNDVIADADVCVGNSVHHIGDAGTGIFLGSDTVHIKANNVSLANLQTNKMYFNEGGNTIDGGYKFSNFVHPYNLWMPGTGSYAGNVGINTATPTHGLTVGDSFKVDQTTDTEVILANLPEAIPAANEVVMIHPTTGRLYTTASSAVIGGGGGSGVTVEGEVISSNTIANYDNTNASTTFPAMTDPDDTTTGLSASYSYLRAEFYAKSGTSSNTTIQAARTVFVWESGSGANLIATTVEDVRTDAAVTLFDINSVTGSWDVNGNLVMTLQQYTQGTGTNVDYKLRYITI